MNQHAEYLVQRSLSSKMHITQSALNFGFMFDEYRTSTHQISFISKYMYGYYHIRQLRCICL